jgi:hypothetical protein
MMFATTLTSRVIVAAGAGILAVGGLGIITPATAHTTESLTPVSLVASASPIETASLSSVPDFCIFGTHHGKGSGCRGGSVNDGPDCLIGHLPTAMGTEGPCAGPHFNWEGVSKESRKCVSGGEGDGFKAGVGGAMVDGLKGAAKGGFPGAAAGCAWGVINNGN